ncbi:MAG TPA: tetratricopeptide repeat protein [Verrucomicrobiae bacterium]|nr:tetratricopeptide repeat protein [Verrucomicrobiae bacterium]
MHSILLGFICVALAAAMPQCAAAADSDTNLGARESDISDADVSFANTNNPALVALEKVMRDDDAAMDEVDSWIQENTAFAAKGAGESKAVLNRRIRARLDVARREYENFLRQYPTNAAAYLAFGSFLGDIGDENGAGVAYEKSCHLDPKNPAVWNDLANFYGENGPITNAFVDYAKAVELNPSEPVYYENWATTVYLFRKDAREFYRINEGQVFDKALALYQRAIKLDPSNFVLMTDYAESYYGIKPLRTNDALLAWTNALSIATNDLEREGVYVHLARVKILAGRFSEAEAQLNAITNSAYDELKRRLQRSLLWHETNNVEASPASSGQKTP